MSSIIPAWQVQRNALAQQLARPALRPEVAGEVNLEDQLCLTGIGFMPCPETPSVPDVPPAQLASQPVAEAPAEPLDPGPGVALGHGGTLLMTYPDPRWIPRPLRHSELQDRKAERQFQQVLHAVKLEDRAPR